MESRTRMMKGMVAIMVALMALVACDGHRDDAGLFGRSEGRGSRSRDREAARISALIADLRYWRQIDDPDAEARYDKAKEELILMGPDIEPDLIEALYEHDDWGVRYGCVEILGAIATRNSIEALIHVLADPEPEVALPAMALLRVLTDHQEIPEEGRSESGLPAVPRRGEDDFDRDADMRIWRAWHESNGENLRRAWRAWWEENKRRVDIR